MTVHHTEGHIASLLATKVDEAVAGLGIWQHELDLQQAGMTRATKRDILTRIAHYNGMLSAYREVASAFALDVPALDIL